MSSDTDLIILAIRENTKAVVELTEAVNASIRRDKRSKPTKEVPDPSAERIQPEYVQADETSDTTKKEVRKLLRNRPTELGGKRPESLPVKPGKNDLF